MAALSGSDPADYFGAVAASNTDRWQSSFTFKPCPSPRPSYWEGNVLLGDPRAAVRATIEAPRDGPHKEQWNILRELAERYIYFVSSALVMLKPAFNRHIGDQRRLQPMSVEFRPVQVQILAFAQIDWRVCGAWELTFRAESRPEYSFAVGYLGERANSLRTDRDVQESP